MSDKMFNDEIRAQLKNIFNGMSNPVIIEFFSGASSPSGAETRQFLEEIAALSDKITLRVNEIPGAETRAAELSIARYPGFAILDASSFDPGIRFYGLPAGHEINSFIYSLMQVAGNVEELPDSVSDTVSSFKKDINIKVFVTLT